MLDLVLYPNFLFFPPSTLIFLFLLDMLADQRLSQLNVPLLCLLLRDAFIDDTLPLLTLGFTLIAVLSEKVISK